MASFIKIDGELVSDSLLDLVEVRHHLNHHSWCRVRCRQTNDERFPAETRLGKDLRVIALDDQGNEHVIFDGFVLQVELEYEIFGSYGARLKAVSRSYKLDLTEHKVYYLDKKLSQIAGEIAKRTGLPISAHVPDKAKGLNYVQWGETDFRFLSRLVDDHGAWMRPTPEGLEICNQFQHTTTLQWRGEQGLRTFRTRGTLGRKFFKGAHYDFHSMESRNFPVTENSPGVSGNPEFFGSADSMVAAVKAGSETMPAGFVHQRSRSVSLDDFEASLKKESIRSVARGVVGVGISLNPEIAAGDKVQIEGILDAQGSYGITKVRHRWNKEGYSNRFWCTPWRNYTNPDPPKARCWYGLVPARVVDHNDPKKMGRLKVQYFWQENGSAYWARMLSQHAGADRGFMFMPEIGDEVAVAFEDGDPERPYVIGSLWNGVNTAPRDPFWGGDIDGNDVKRIVTKSGHRIQLNDKAGKEAIVIATPNKLRLSLLEQTDDTGRPMILLHAAEGDMVFSAPNGRIHLHSKYFSREVGASGAAASPNGRSSGATQSPPPLSGSGPVATKLSSSKLPPSTPPSKAVGALSAKYESNGKPGSIGWDRKGGYSYGQYQIASKPGTMASFLDSLKTTHPTMSKALEAAGGTKGAAHGTNHFKAAWRKLAKEDPEGFAQAQHDFIRSTHYEEQVSSLRKEIGIDVTQRSSALQNVVWSMAVQNRAQTPKIFTRALNGRDPAQVSDRELIPALYKERGKVDTYFPSSTDDVQESVKTRYVMEQRDAMRMLSEEDPISQVGTKPN